jgi:hypothetical protein
MNSPLVQMAPIIMQRRKVEMRSEVSMETMGLSVSSIANSLSHYTRAFGEDMPNRYATVGGGRDNEAIGLSVIDIPFFLLPIF